MLIDFRILRNVGQAQDEDDMKQNTEVCAPPKKYPAGTLSFWHDFERGDYIGMVTAQDSHGRIFVSRFPFRVGLAFGLAPYAVGGLVLAAAVGFFLAHRRSPALSRAVQRALMRQI